MRTVRTFVSAFPSSRHCPSTPRLRSVRYEQPQSDPWRSSTLDGVKGCTPLFLRAVGLRQEAITPTTSPGLTAGMQETGNKAFTMATGTRRSENKNAQHPPYEEQRDDGTRHMNDPVANCFRFSKIEHGGIVALLARYSERSTIQRISSINNRDEGAQPVYEETYDLRSGLHHRRHFRRHLPLHNLRRGRSWPNSGA
jgi:hypothetical protein